MILVQNYYLVLVHGLFLILIIPTVGLYINLQWGTNSITVTKDFTYADINLPVSCTRKEPLFIIPSIMCNSKNNTKDFNIQCSGSNTTSISFVIRCLSTTLDNFTFKWCIISK